MQRLKFVTALAVFILLTGLSVNVSALTDAEWAAMKQQALNRDRVVIYNNDGADAMRFPISLPVTEANLIAERLIHTLGSTVDTISYCPLASCFTNLTTRTDLGYRCYATLADVLALGRHNITETLHNQGTDPAKIASDFSANNNFEFFITLRVNDTHDHVNTYYDPYELFSPYKTNNPNLLMGTFEDCPSYCYARWSAYDFTEKVGVRDYFVAIAKECIDDYNLDGLELDFCRHLHYFPSVAEGGTASQTERDMLTDMLTEIRDYAEQVGRLRERPILISIRVPDSVAYCEAIGIDLEEWMQEGLFDLLISSFYFRLNPWQSTANLCHSYGIKCYASMDESRIEPRHDAFDRYNLPTDRGRQSAALRAGVDGFYLFNREGANALQATFYDNLNDLKLKDKRYFITYRDYSPQLFYKYGENYNNLPMLCRRMPLYAENGQTATFTLEIGDDFTDPEVLAAGPVMTAYADIAHLDIDPSLGERVILKLNGTELTQIANPPAGTVGFQVPLSLCQAGVNQVEISADPASQVDTIETLILKGDTILTGSAQFPWERIFSHSVSYCEAIQNGALYMRDTSPSSERIPNLVYPLNGIPGQALKTKFQLKVESSTMPYAVSVRIANGNHVEIVTFETDKVSLCYANQTINFDTTDDFHDYEIAMNSNGCTTVKIDGIERLSGTTIIQNAYITRHRFNVANIHKRSLAFGSLTTSGQGAAWWKNIYLVEDTSKVVVRDLKFELKFASTSSPLEQYGTVTPDWDYDLHVVDYEIPVIPNLNLSYLGSSVVPIGNIAMRFNKGTDIWQRYTLTDSNVVNNSDIVIYEYRIKYPEKDPSYGGIYFSFFLENDSGETISYYAILYRDSLKDARDYTLVSFPDITATWVTIRTAIDVENQEAAVWMDGELLDIIPLPIDRSRSPGVAFGNNTSRVSGLVYVQYVKIDRYQ